MHQIARSVKPAANRPKLIVMRLATILGFLLLCATPLAAFNPSAETGQPRICILRTDYEEDEMTTRVAAMMRGFLAKELRDAGFETVHSRATFNDVLEGDDADIADIYVEFVRGDAEDYDYGGIGVAGRHGGVELGVVMAQVAAGIRVYDARTMQLIDEFSVEARDRAVLPTAIGAGGRHVGLWIGVPLMRGLRYRAVAREAAADAAETIAELLE